MAETAGRVKPDGIIYSSDGTEEGESKKTFAAIRKKMVAALLRHREEYLGGEWGRFQRHPGFLQGCIGRVLCSILPRRGPGIPCLYPGLIKRRSNPKLKQEASVSTAFQTQSSLKLSTSEILPIVGMIYGRSEYSRNDTRFLGGGEANPIYCQAPATPHPLPIMYSSSILSPSHLW